MIVKWNGLNWEEVGGGITKGETVTAMVPTRLGLFAVGLFDEVGGIAATNIAVWNSNTWTAVGQGIYEQHYALRTIAETAPQIVVGGSFTHAGGKPSTNIALWHKPRTLDIRTAVAANSQTNAVVSWPAVDSDLELESASALESPLIWRPVTQTPVTNQNRLTITNAISGAKQFYRLRSRN